MDPDRSIPAGPAARAAAALLQPEICNVPLEDVIAETRRDKRVCPLAPEWEQLYHMLPAKRRLPRGWEPPLPYIGDVWAVTSHTMKRMCLREHIEWAARHGCLDEVFAFLRSLPEDRWLHTD